MDYSLQSKTAEHLISLGKAKHCRQPIVAIDKKGKTHFKGNLDKRLALKELEKTVLKEDALEKEWLPDDLDSFPRLPGPLSDILKNGNMTKRAAAAAVNWMLKKTNSKLGRDKLLLLQPQFHDINYKPLQ